MGHTHAVAVRVAGFICLTLGLLFILVATFFTWERGGLDTAIHGYDLSRWRVWWADVVVLTPGFLLIVLAELLDPGVD